MTSVALAHDVLGARAGGERVLVALCDAYPDAPIHTLLYEPQATFAAFTSRDIKTSWVHRSSWLRRNYRMTAPIAALTFAAKQINADVTVCSTSGMSHHVRTTGAKVVYCHTPSRWLHDRRNYMLGFSLAARGIAGALGPPLAMLDRRAMRGADIVVANSRQVAREIEDLFDVEAIVVHPCSTMDIDAPTSTIDGLRSGFVLTPARPLGYKRLDVILHAASLMPDQLFVQIGDGPHRSDLMRNAPDNVVSLGSVSDGQLRWAYRHASVVALSCAEDYGLVPLEAAAHGVHTVAPAERGILDHAVDQMTTYQFGSAAALVDVIRNAPRPTGVRDVALLGRQRFVDEMRSIVASVA